MASCPGIFVVVTLRPPRPPTACFVQISRRGARSSGGVVLDPAIRIVQGVCQGGGSSGRGGGDGWGVRGSSPPGVCPRAHADVDPRGGDEVLEEAGQQRYRVRELEARDEMGEGRGGRRGVWDALDGSAGAVPVATVRPVRDREGEETLVPLTTALSHVLSFNTAAISPVFTLVLFLER